MRKRCGQAASLVFLLGSACLARRAEIKSIFPPEDFLLRVSLSRIVRGERHEVRRFDVDHEGLCVLREATEGIGGKALQTDWFPVWSKLCAYRLRPQSTRTLSRLLDRAGLFELSTKPGGDPREVEGPQIRIDWRGFGQKLSARAGANVYGPLVRVIRVINSFLPDGHAFEVADMSARTTLEEIEESHLIRVPQPVESLQGSLAFFSERLNRSPDDLDLLVDVFVLLLRAGKNKEAEGLLLRLESIEKKRVPAEQIWPQALEDKEMSLSLQLRRLLAERQ